MNRNHAKGLALGAMAAFAPGAMAQDAAPGGVALEEIIVTAEKRETNLQNTAVSVTALDGEYLADYGIDDIAELGNRVVGLAFEAVDRTEPGLYLRGNGGGSTAGEDAGVSLFIDEVYYAGSDVGVDLFDIERVEVLRGPQGTLFGRNVVGGAIHIVTEKPDEEFDGALELTAGRWSQTILNGKISGALSDNLFASLAMKSEHTDGWAENLTTGGDMGSIEQWSMRGKLRHFSDTGIETNLSLSYLKDDSGGIPFFVLPGSSVPNLIPNTLVDQEDRVTNAFDGSTDREAKGWTLRVEIPVPAGADVTLTSITAWHGNDSMAVGPDQAATGSPDVFILFSGLREDSTASQELRLTGLSERAAWTAGLYYMDVDRLNVPQVQAQWHPMSEVAALNSVCHMFGLCPPDQPNTLLAPADSPNQPLGFVTTAGADVNTTSLAAFGQVSYALNDASNLTVGMRWTRDEREGRSFVRGDYGPFNPFASQLYDVTYDGSWSAFTPKLTYDMLWEGLDSFDSVFFYATVARGFNSGGFAVNTTPQAAVRGYDPEYAINYELGVKTRFYDNRAQLNVTAYYTDYTDLVTGVVTVTEAGFPFTSQQNAGKATIKGIELEATALLTERFTASLSYAYTDGVYDELIDEQPGGSTDLSGNRIEQSPRNAVNVDLNYGLPVGDGELAFALNYSYRSEKTFGQDEAAEVNTIPLTDYAKVNVDVSYAWAGWRIAAWGKNLTNEQELNFQIGGALEGFVYNRQFGIDPMTATYTAGGLAQPRSYGVTVSKRWQ